MPAGRRRYKFVGAARASDVFMVLYNPASLPSGDRPLASAEIGIIGGSGLYSMPGFTDAREERVETPFGAPSDPYVVGTLAGRRVAFLARHGRGHRIPPSELNFRANIHGFKQLGVGRIVSLSAGGSRKGENKPPHPGGPHPVFHRAKHRPPPTFS